MTQYRQYGHHGPFVDEQLAELERLKTAPNETEGAREVVFGHERATALLLHLRDQGMRLAAIRHRPEFSVAVRAAAELLQFLVEELEAAEVKGLRQVRTAVDRLRSES